MGNCWSDSKITAERFEVEKQVIILSFLLLYEQFGLTLDPTFSSKCQNQDVERHLQSRKRRNMREGLGVADDSKSVNII